MRETMITSLCLLVAAAVGCAGEANDSGAGGGGGGNVGFGGAQDIGQFRSLLAAGAIPGPSTLDANGFFSEHRTELPPPDCGQTLCANGMLAVGRAWIDDDYQATLQIALNTPVDPGSFERPPLNMIVVVDVSGSMAADDRLTYVKQGLHLLIDDLEPGDRLGIVTYSSNAGVLRGLDVASEPSELHAIVDSLVADGGTNIYDGLETGFLEASSHFDLERQNRVVLLSDGLATAGIVGDEDILNMATGYISEGIGLTTIGVGLDFNVNLMRGLSERGAGNFYFVESSAAVTEVFTEELDYFVSPLALSVAIDVEAADGYRLGDVAGTRLWKTSGRDGQMLIPAVFPASRVDDENPSGRRGGGSALFIDVVPEGGITSAGPVATITLSYTLPGASERTTQTVVVENPFAPGELGDDLYVSQAAMIEHYAVYNMFLGLFTATRHAELGDYNCAVATLDRARAAGIEWNQEFTDSDIAADIELVDQFTSNLVAAGAQRDASLDGCADLPPRWEDGGDDVVYGPACSAAGGAGAEGGLLVLMALLLGLRRRRRDGGWV